MIVCATANPVELLVASTGRGRRIVGAAPLGVETAADQTERKVLLHKIGYKTSRGGCA
jgi:uncharacterized protein